MKSEFPRPIAVILAGGCGTRLQALHPECPKPLVTVLGRPFIEYLVEYLEQQGVTEIILSTGYRGNQIESHFGGRKLVSSIRCIREERPMGTGGAIAHVLSSSAIREPVLVLNGDSIAGFNIDLLCEAVCHGVDGAVVGVHIQESGRYGSMIRDEHGMLKGFAEKCSGGGPGLINAGIYLLRPSLFPAGQDIQPASIEHDYFPRWLQAGRKIAVIASKGPFIDIGTPDSLSEAPRFLKGCGLFSSAG